jgi:hypothetical protein
MNARLVAVLFTVLLAASGCGDNPTSPDSTSSATTTGTSSVVYEGTLTPNGSGFYSFNASATGLVSAHLASLALVGHRDALPVSVRIGVGVPKGEGCALSQSVDTAAALVTQLTAPLITTGIYCIGIVDIGALPGAAVFSIRFTHP